MRGDGKLRRLAAIGLVCLGLLAGPMLAREPEGVVRLEVERVGSGAGQATPRALRIRIEPFVQIRDVRLSYLLPGEIDLEPVDGDLARAVQPAGAGADGRRRSAILLGTLHAPRLLHFGVVGAVAPGQMPIRFELIGRRVDGTEFRTTRNVALAPDDRPSGRLVHGAWQFDARPLDGRRP